MKPTGGKRAKTSKRQSCAMRYKVERKVREHRRKQNKMEKAQERSRRVKKDPGIPNLHPLKESLILKAQEMKERMEESKRRQREARQRELAKARKAKSGNDLAALARSAAQRDAEFEELRASALDAVSGDAPTDRTGMTENSRKAYYKEFKKVVDLADVVLEVLDARDPLACRCPHVERAVLAAGSNKRLVLVLNKIDLVPRAVVEDWLKYLRNEFPVIAFKASTQSQKQNLSQGKRDALEGGDSAGAECRGAGTLLKLLGNYCRNSGIRTTIRVGVVGYPNVGKSSIINSLKRSRVCGVGATPGFTKASQEIVLDKHVHLLDSPGIVFSSGTSDADLILRNVVKLETLEDPVVPVDAILRRCDQRQIMEMYQVPTFSSTIEFLQQIAHRHGRLKKGGVPDTEGAARIVLQDWNGGKISYYTRPPAEGFAKAHLAADVVAAWGKEFDLASLLDQQNQDVSASSTMREDGMLSMEASAVLDADDDMMGDDDDEDEEDEGMNGAGAAAMDEAAEGKQYITNIKKKTKKGADKGTARPSVVFEEDLLNPQRGKELKKTIKMMKKAERRALAAPSGGGDYDFATDFAPGRGGMVDDEEYGDEDDEEGDDDQAYDDDEDEEEEDDDEL